jgi:ribonuclease HI
MCTRLIQDSRDTLAEDTDRKHVDGIPAPGFVEVRRSGRVWARDEIINSPYEDFEAILPLPDFAVRYVTVDVALVTYRSQLLGRDVLVTNRSSIWRRSDGRWRLEFHQGTPTGL